MKKCYHPDCQKMKEDSEFYVDKHSRNGLSGYCKECLRKVRRERYADPTERKKIKKNNKKYSSKPEVKLKKKEYDHQRRIDKPETREQKDRRNLLKRKRRKKNPSYAIRERISNHLRIILNSKGSRKSKTTKQLIGYEPKKLANLFETLHFNDVYSWDNIAEWDIDHYIPKSLFDHTDPLQVKLCWHYTNLRPLMRGPNQEKGDTPPLLLVYLPAFWL